MKQVERMKQVENWWMYDPSSLRNGVGVILHLEKGGWKVFRTLKGSPAEAAGIDKGDKVVSINGYDLMGGDIEEALFLGGLRAPDNSYYRDDGTLHLQVRHAGKTAEMVLELRPLRDLIAQDAASGGEREGYCYTCRFCRFTFTGYKRCGLDGCRVRCIAA